MGGEIGQGLQFNSFKGVEGVVRDNYKNRLKINSKFQT